MNGTETVAEKVAARYVLGKLKKAGIEVISDKNIFDMTLADIREKSAVLSMFGRRKENTVFYDANSRDETAAALLAAQKADSPVEFRSALEKALSLKNSRYCCTDKGAIRISSRFVSGAVSDCKKGIIIQIATKNEVRQFVYPESYPTKEKKEDIIIGIMSYLDTGIFSGRKYESVRNISKKELEEGIAQEMTLSGVKNAFAAGLVAVSMGVLASQAAAETVITNVDSKAQTVTMSTKLDVIKFDTGETAVINRNNWNDGDYSVHKCKEEEKKFSCQEKDLVVLFNASGEPVALYRYGDDDFNSFLALENGHYSINEVYTPENKMTVKQADEMSSAWRHLYTCAVHAHAANSAAGMVGKRNIDGDVSDECQRLANAWCGGAYEASGRTCYMQKGRTTYGFTKKGKIYLDPEIMNSNVAVHEYTHLWDEYTKRTNFALWKKGKAVFSKTHLWMEVKSDPAYADIRNNDDLVLSECHARICGEAAQKVLERIAREDGKIAEDRVIDWKTECAAYLRETLTIDDRTCLKNTGFTEKEAVAFMAETIKNLIEGKIIRTEKVMMKTEEKKIYDGIGR